MTPPGRQRVAGHWEQGVDIRRDHVAGGLVAGGGALVLASSRDLPFGTLASPGAGMMPMVVAALMMILGTVLFVRAGESPPFAQVSWSDLPHAVSVIIVTAAGIALYTTLGFVATMALILLVLTIAIERKPVLPAAVFSIGITLLTYALFNMLLKAPLPRGIIGF